MAAGYNLKPIDQLSKQEIKEAQLHSEIYKKSLFKTFDVMSLVGFVDFLDLAAVFLFKVFIPTMFMAVIPYLMLETSFAALSNIVTFWLVAHFDRHKAGHDKEGQMKKGHVVKAAMITFGATLIVTAGMLGYALSYITPYVIPIFTIALMTGALHNVGQTIYNYFKYKNCKTPEETKNIAGKIYNHFFIGLALSLSLIGAVGSSPYVGILALGTFAVVGGLIGATHCLVGLLPEKYSTPIKNFAYRLLGLSAALDNTSKENAANKKDAGAAASTHEKVAERLPTHSPRAKSTPKPVANDTPSVSTGKLGQFAPEYSPRGHHDGHRAHDHHESRRRTTPRG